MSDLVGKTIRGYDIHEDIGSGGFATVYRAYQKAVDREVALKVILPKHSDRQQFAQRFEQEAQIVARLEHFNIVPIYDYWYSDEHGACMVMRYLEGSSLDKYIDLREYLDLQTTARIIRQVCEALHFAHERDIVHRDMKPANILLDDDGNAFVTDFGVAKALTAEEEMHLTRTGEVVGTPSYFAPEQATDSNIDPRVDVYSMGIVAYECLVGQYPFPGQPFQHLTRSLPDATDFVPDLPVEVNAVLTKATEHDPDNRYQSARELGEALQQVADDFAAGRIDSSGTEEALPENFIFISYHDDDAAAADEVAEHLNLLGIKTSSLELDPDDPNYGNRREALLLSALDGIILLSEQSASSARVRAEWREILRQNKRLYTVTVDDIGEDAFPFRLQLTPTFYADDDDSLNTLAQTIIGDRLDDSDPTQQNQESQALHLLARSADYVTAVADVPHRIRQLVGRADLMAQVEDDLTQHGRVLLQGLGGIGKTTLAAAIAERSLETVSDGDDADAILWLTVGDDEAAMILRALLKPLLQDNDDALPMDDTQDIAKRLREAMHEQGVRLLVLDDIWTNGAELKKIMMGLPDDIPVLMTSRERYPVGKIIDVNVLPVTAAIDLINLHAYSDYDSDDAEVVALCETLGRHTLALEIAAKTMQVDSLSPAGMMQRLDEAPHTIAMPYGFAEEGRESVKSLLDASIAILDNTASEVFFTFGVLPNPSATPELLGLLLDQPRPELDTALNELTQRGLVTQVTDDGILHYRLHDLAHAYARTNRQLTKRRAVEAAHGYVTQYQDDLTRLDAERDNVLTLAQLAYNIGRAEDFVGIVYTLAVESDYLKARGHDVLFLRQLDNAIDVTRNLDDKEKLHYLLGKRADTYFDRGNHAAAIEMYTESVGLAEELDLRERQVIVLCAMSRPHMQLEKLDQAEQILDMAQDIAKKSENIEMMSRVLNNKGILAFNRQNMEDARKYFQDNADLIQQTDDPGDLFFAYKNLSGIDIYLGNLEKALPILRKALQIAEKQDNLVWQGDAHYALGGLYHEKEEREQSLEHLKQAVELFEKAGMTGRVDEIENYMRENYNNLTD